jgi:CysZ protein
MQKIFDALTRALASLLHPQMLLLCIAPLLLAGLVWLVVVALTWHDGWMWMRGTLESGLGAAGSTAESLAGPWAGRVEPPEWMHGMMAMDGEAIAGGLLAVATGALLLVLLVPAVWMTALVNFALIAMPWTVSLVGRRDYTGLERLEGGNWLGSLWNAMVAVAVFVVLWLLTLPLWLLGGLGALLGLALTGWVTQRLLRYDALALHATAAERRLVIERAGGRLWLLGIVITLLAIVPLFNLVLPVYAGLAVTHLCLMELAEVRREGPVVG